MPVASFSPTIMKRWIKEGYAIEETIQPVRASFELDANTSRRVPAENHTFHADEGAITVFSATFDHPNMGIRVEYGLPGDNQISLKDNYTVQNYMIGSSRYDQNVYVHVPPDTPPGIYLITRQSHWFWGNWLRLTLFNPDSSAHWVLGYGYQIIRANKGETIT